MNRPLDVDQELTDAAVCVRDYVRALETELRQLRGAYEHQKDRNRSMSAQLQVERERKR